MKVWINAEGLQLKRRDTMQFARGKRLQSTRKKKKKKKTRAMFDSYAK